MVGILATLSQIAEVGFDECDDEKDHSAHLHIQVVVNAALKQY